MATWLNIAFTFVIAVATVAYVLFTRRLWQETKKSADAATKAADAATAAATIYRPYIGLVCIGQPNDPHNKWWTFKFSLQNYGNSPAVSVSAKFELMLSGETIASLNDPKSAEIFPQSGHNVIFTCNLGKNARRFAGGGTITYRERVVNDMSPRVLAQEIVEKNAGDKISEIVLSGDAFSKKTSDLTIAIQMGEIFRQNGLPSPVQAELTHEARISGWQLMYSLLESKEWHISDACPALIECIPTLIRDEDDLEDVLKVEGDDPAGAARYGIWARMRPGHAPFEVTFQEELSLISDPTSRAIHAQRLLAQQRERIRCDGMEGGGGKT